MLTHDVYYVSQGKSHVGLKFESAHRKYKDSLRNCNWRGNWILYATKKRRMRMDQQIRLESQYHPYNVVQLPQNMAEGLRDERIRHVIFPNDNHVLNVRLVQKSEINDCLLSSTHSLRYVPKGIVANKNKTLTCYHFLNHVLQQLTTEQLHLLNVRHLATNNETLIHRSPTFLKLQETMKRKLILKQQ